MALDRGMHVLITDKLLITLFHYLFVAGVEDTLPTLDLGHFTNAYSCKVIKRAT